jgi:hypothetical protein
MPHGVASFAGAISEVAPNEMASVKFPNTSLRFFSFPSSLGLLRATGKLGSDAVPLADEPLRRACKLGHADACAALAGRMPGRAGEGGE